jgi:serine/threonine protein kinase/Tol biopolymer transport system component
MSLLPGTRLGAYEVTAKLGEGGMGEVYQARDTTLDRDVAIKILPATSAGDSDRVARFQREAKALAAFNHPNIAQIYGFEQSSSAGPEQAAVLVLVMELVAGEDLAERLKRGPVPLQEALRLARQLTDALEAAHGRGIIHRDLKPANIKVVRGDGTLKVLDFGLAKMPWNAPAEAGALTEAMTSPAVTGQGMIMGTAAYMSPEQARGQAVDTRTDIWAFGCVLYEMLTGRGAFAGASVTDTLVAVVDREPDWTALPPSTPTPIRRLLRRCLKKSAQQRLADIADARIEIDDAVTPPGDELPSTSAPRASLSPYGIGAIVAATTIAASIATWAWMRNATAGSSDRPAISYVAASLGVDTPNLAELAERFAVAPESGIIVFLDRSRGSLFVRSPGDVEARPLAGAPADALLPVISPDGQWVAYFTETALQKSPLAGGPPVHLLNTIPQVSLTWGRDDRLRFPATDLGGIQSIASSGGSVDTLAAPANTRFRRAEWLPNGRLLVSIASGDDEHIAVREADGTLRTLVAGRFGKQTPTGHLLYTRGEGPVWSLVAAPFDDATANITGDPIVVARDVPIQYATPGAVTAAGDLVYLRGSARSDRRVVTIDRTAAERDLPVPPGAWVDLSRSPNAGHLALNRWDGARRTLWTFALDSHALTQVTYESDCFYPSWFPDGRRLLFTNFTHRLPAVSMWSIAVSGQSPMEPLSEHADAYPSSTSPDGRVIYYRAITAQGDEDIYSVELQQPAPVRKPLLTTRATEESPLVSPDGRWLAYSTNASGRSEVRIAALADLAVSVQVSSAGGRAVRWSADSRRLFYRDDDAIAAVDLGPSGPVLDSRTQAFRLPSDVRGRVDVMPDGHTAVLIRGGLMYSDLVVVQSAFMAEGR